MAGTEYLPRTFQNDNLGNSFKGMRPTYSCSKLDGIFFVDRSINAYLWVDGAQGGKKGFHDGRGQAICTTCIVDGDRDDTAVCRIRDEDEV